MIYCYFTHMGLASLSKMFTNGNDVDKKPVKIGKFTNEASAKVACIEHHKKACKMARAAGRYEPAIMWM